MNNRNSDKANKHNSNNHDQSMVYQIRIEGRLDRQWTGWFAGLDISYEGNEETSLTGPVADQCALHGLLKKVRDLGLPLLSVNRLQPAEANMPDIQSQMV